MSAKQFKSWKEFNKELNRDGVDTTFLIGHIEARPAELVRLFGEPCEADGYKVSGEYMFKIWDRYVTLYDWKMTSLYDEDLLSPQDFWNLEEPVTLSVGSHNTHTHEQAFTVYLLLDLIQSTRRKKSLKEASNG